MTQKQMNVLKIEISRPVDTTRRDQQLNKKYISRPTSSSKLMALGLFPFLFLRSRFPRLFSRPTQSRRDPAAVFTRRLQNQTFHEERNCRKTRYTRAAESLRSWIPNSLRRQKASLVIQPTISSIPSFRIFLKIKSTQTSIRNTFGKKETNYFVHMFFFPINRQTIGILV